MSRTYDNPQQAIYDELVSIRRILLAQRTEPAPAQERCVCCGHTYSDHTGTVPTGSTDTPCIRCECSNFIAPMRPEALTDWASFNIDDPTPAQADAPAQEYKYTGPETGNSFECAYCKHNHCDKGGLCMRCGHSSVPAQEPTYEELTVQLDAAKAEVKRLERRFATKEQVIIREMERAEKAEAENDRLRAALDKATGTDSVLEQISPNGYALRVPAQPVPQSAGRPTDEETYKRIYAAAIEGYTGGGQVQGGMSAFDECEVILRPVIEAEARKGLYSDAEIEKAIVDEMNERHTGGTSYGLAVGKSILARLSPHKEERVTVEDHVNICIVYLDGELEAQFKKPAYARKDAERYATGLRAEIREGKL